MEFSDIQILQFLGAGERQQAAMLAKASSNRDCVTAA